MDHQVLDEFHFKQNAIQMLNGEIGSNIDQIRFLKLMLHLFEAKDQICYDKIYDETLLWIDQTEQRSKRLKPYVEWWHNRRDSWSAAFICHDVDRHSLAESGNGGMARKGIAKNLSLDECLKFELSKYLTYGKKVKERLSYRPKGRTRVDLEDDALSAMYDRVRNCVLTEGEANEDVAAIMKSLRISTSKYFASSTSDENRNENSVVDFLQQSTEPLIIPSSKRCKDPNFRFKHQKVDIIPALQETATKRKVGRSPNSGKKRRVSMKGKFPSSDNEAENTIPKQTQDPKWARLVNRVENEMKNYV